jgi:hypothetical protein
VAKSQFVFVKNAIWFVAILLLSIQKILRKGLNGTANPTVANGKSNAPLAGAACGLFHLTVFSF